MRSLHAWGDLQQAVMEKIPTCPQHPERCARTIKERSNAQILYHDGNHIHVKIIMNPYYRPEDMNLELVATLEEDESYQFHIVAAWIGTVTETFRGHRATTYRIYWATDSGCSCPSPFEDYTTIEDLGVYNGSQESWQEIIAATDEVDVSDADRVDFLREVQAKYREYCQ